MALLQTFKKEGSLKKDVVCQNKTFGMMIRNKVSHCLTVTLYTLKGF